MAFTLQIPSIEEMRRDLTPLLTALREAAPELPDAALSTAPLQLLRLAGPLPASEAHHDAGPLGLVRHSLRVACLSAELYRARRPRPEGADERRRWEQGLAVCVLAALVHDIGKIWLMDVTHDQHVLPYGRYLMSWAEELKLSEITVSWRPGRTRLGPTGHESLSLCLLVQVVPIGLVSWIGSRAVNDLLATLASSLGAEPSDSVYLLIKEADIRASREAMPVRSHQVVSQPAQPSDYTPGSASIADDFVNGFRMHAGDHRLKFNVPDGQILISSSHTILFITTQGVGSPFQVVYEAMRQKALAIGLGGYVASFYSGGKAMSYLDEIAARSTRDGLSWCVPAEDRQTHDARSIRHWIEVSDSSGRRRRTGYAIVMRNAVLWGNDARDRGTFTGFVRLCSERRSTDNDRLASVDPEDLGFTPFPDHAKPRSAKPFKISSMVPAHEADAVTDLETVAAQLVQEVAGLTGTEDADLPRWSELVRSANPRLPELLVQPALEACVDRLRHLRAGGAPSAVHQAPASSGIPAAETQPPQPQDTLAEQVLKAVTAVVLAARAGATASKPVPSGHAVLVPDGSVFVLWPQGLSLLLSPEEVVAARPAGDELCPQVGLPAPSSWAISGYPYRGLQRSHRGVLIGPEWIPPISATPAQNIVVFQAPLNPG